MKVTEQTFITYLDSLPIVDLVDKLTGMGYTHSDIFRGCVGEYWDADYEAFKEKGHHKCFICCDYYTEPEDLNDNDLCEDCAEEQERKILGIKER